MFLKIKLKILPYKNNLSFCSLGKLSSKTVTPLYLKSSMTCCTPIHSLSLSLSLSLSFTHTQMLKCITRYPLASTHSVGSVCLNQFTEEKIGAKIWNKKFRLFLNCFYAISSKKKNGSRFILPATTIIIDIIITTMYCSLICKHPLLNKRP